MADDERRAEIEAVARALFDYHHRGSGDFDADFEWADLELPARTYWCELADVALIEFSRSSSGRPEQPEPDALGGLPPSQPKEDKR
jgi:hypothetical protein